MVVDAWMQHPTERLFRHPMLAPLMRWTGQEPPRGEIPLAVTLEAMDAGGVDRGLISAWTGPDGDLISNDEVAGWVAQAPDRLAGLAVGRPPRPGPRRARAAPLRHRAGLQGPADRPLAVGLAAERPPLLPAVRRVRGARRPVLHPGRPHRAAAQLRDRPPDPLPRRRRARLPRPDDRRRPHRLPVDGGDGRARAQVPQRLHRHVGLHRAALPARAGPLPARRRQRGRSCSARTGR